MNKIHSNAIKTGIMAGVILIFSEMINLSSTMAIILEKLLTGAKSVKVVNPAYLASVIALIVFFVAFSYTRKIRKNGRQSSVLNCILCGLIIGIVSGLLISLLNVILGTFLENGKDVRGYLEALSPDTIRSFLFQTDIRQAAGTYFMMTLGGSLTGVAFAFLIEWLHWSAEISRKIRRRVSKLNISAFFQERPALRVVAVVAIIAVVLAIPFLVNAYLISVLGLVLVYAMMGLGLNLIVGLSGQLVFGYVAFYAIGGYTFALLTAPKPLGIEMHFVLAFIFALVASGLAGVLVGLPIMNLRGDYLAIVTLGFAEIVRILVNSNLLGDYTGGPQGVKNIGQPAQPAFFEKLLGKPMPDNIWFLYLILFSFLLILYIAFRLQYSRTGRSWEAMREDETVAQACGVNTGSYKVLSIVIGAVIAGAVGAVYASRNTYIGPGEYGFMVSVNALAVVVVGGMGSIPGTLLGAFIIKGLPELLRDLDNYRMLVFGALLVIMMVLRPEGLLPIKRRHLSVKPESIEVLKEDLKP